jgi:hypothetical protein
VDKGEQPAEQEVHLRGRFQRLLRDFGSDGTTWRAAIFEQGSAKDELSARISTLFNAKGTPIEDFLKPDALSEECERDFRRLQEDYVRIAAQAAKRRSSEKS